MHIVQNGQTNFKNLAANVARFLKCIHWKVKDSSAFMNIWNVNFTKGKPFLLLWDGPIGSRIYKDCLGWAQFSSFCASWLYFDIHFQLSLKYCARCQKYFTNGSNWAEKCKNPKNVANRPGSINSIVIKATRTVFFFFKNYKKKKKHKSNFKKT